MALLDRLTPPREAWRRPPVLAVPALNLIPAFCVLWFGWSTGLLFLLCWLENLVIGVFQALKMLVASFTEGAKPAARRGRDRAFSAEAAAGSAKEML